MSSEIINRSSASRSDDIRGQLDRILRSEPFRKSQRRQRFLAYIVGETLAGRGDQLKAYTIAVEVFERPPSFDPLVDPLVRVEAGRLRDKLREYYETEGQDDSVRIELPKGGYEPRIEVRSAAAPNLPEPRPASTGDAADMKAPTPSLSTGPDEAGGAPVQLADALTSQAAGKPRLMPASLSGATRNQIGALAAALILLAAAGLWQIRASGLSTSLSDRPSIAVLPFENIGSDPRWNRFADGTTEDIITDLSHFKNLVVIARSSTAVYKGKPLDVRQIGRELNVKYVLEGSIQPIDERLRVTAQLSEAGSGSHVWSERFDRPVTDLFAVQSEVTQRIAATLGGYQGAVAEAERRLIKRKPPASLTAFDTYLLAIEAKHTVTKDGLAEAERLFKKAVELDPQFARAYVGLVDTYWYTIDLGLAPSVEDAVAKMTEAAEKAVKSDPDDGRAQYSLGLAHLYQGKREQAAIGFARGEALAPSDADMLICIAWSIPALGQSDRAVQLAERALVLNPHYPDWYNQGLSYTFFFGRQFERSLNYRQLVKSPLALDYAYMAMAYAELGRESEAKAAAAEAGQLNPAWIAEQYLSESGGMAESEAELFMTAARKAGLPDCVPTAKLKEMTTLLHDKSCDAARARTSG